MNKSLYLKNKNNPCEILKFENYFGDEELEIENHLTIQIEKL
jgi:hypothetical protein